MYLDSFVFPDEDWEWNARLAEKRTCYNTMYPMGVLSGIGLERLDFAPITILYGGNGTRQDHGPERYGGQAGAAAGYPRKQLHLHGAYVRACGPTWRRTFPHHSPHGYQRRRVRLYAQPP